MFKKKNENICPKYDIESIIKEYGNDVLRTAYLYTQNMDEAEDIFQMVFIKVYENISKFKGESSLKTWIIRITINTCKDQLKSSWNVHTSYITEEIEENEKSDDVFESVEKNADAQKVRDAVLALPEHYKEVVVYVFYHELSIKETADILKVPEGTVKSRLNRAKKELAKMLLGEEV